MSTGKWVPGLDLRESAALPRARDVIPIAIVCMFGCTPPAGDGEGPDTTEGDGDGEPGDGDGEPGDGDGEPNDDCEPIADGLVRCPDGVVNRVAPGTYDPSVPSANSCKGDEPLLECVADSECNAKPYGACVQGYAQDVGEQCIPKCSCVYACASDADCEPDEACIPPEVHDHLNPWPQCQRASCRDADDCEGGECGVGYEVLGYCGEDAAPLGCRTADDECRTSDECLPGHECKPGPDGWACGISHSE